MNPVQNWFGLHFEQLHPDLQKLHLMPSRLTGDIDVQFGKGIAALLGKRLARKMGLPISAGTHKLSVDIFHDAQGLHWNRTFNSQQTMYSLFKPVGNWENGYWLESTGTFRLQLSVEIRNGGWYWQQQRLSLAGIPLPLFLMPKVVAGKRVENGQYCFFVGLFYPGLGKLLSYSGNLQLEEA